MPSSLRHKFKYELATQSYGYPGSPFISIDEPTVKLAGKKLALSFRPATDDDQAIIESYIPEPDPETGEIDVSGQLTPLFTNATFQGNNACNSSSLDMLSIRGLKASL